MFELLILIVTFLLLILFVVWGHFIKQSHSDTIVNNTQRDDTNVSLYHEHKSEIEKDFKQGRIDEEDYQYLLTELDKSLLQDIEENKKSSVDEVTQNKTMSIIWPLSLTLFVLVFSFWLYNKNGAYKQLSQPLNTPNQQAQHSGDQAQQMVAHIKSLIDLTVTEPNNSDAWFELGQAFISIGEFSKAAEAFDKVISIEGDSAELFGAKAQAYYYRDNQKITPDVQQLIDKATALDPKDPSTNILIGMHNFINENYAIAIKYWEVVINSNKSNVNTQALVEAVNEAKARLNNSQVAPQLTQPDNMNTNNSEALGPQLTVRVEVSETITQQLIQGIDKTVFIYAVSSDAKHGRMPVAAVKLRASDLPVTVVLNDSKAMTPQAKISDVPQVNIYAVVSASGSVGVKSGDYKAELLNTDVSTTEPLLLTIDTIVP